MCGLVSGCKSFPQFSLAHLSVLDVRFLDKQQNKSGFSTLFECLGCLSVCLSVLAGKYRHVAKPSLA